MISPLRFLILLLFSVAVFPGQGPFVSSDTSSLQVLEFKWSKSRQFLEKVEPVTIVPARPETAANRNYERNKVNATAGTRDPYLDSWEGRSAALEKSIQQARTPPNKPLEGFRYQIKVQNTAARAADIVFWEYQFIDPSNPAVQTRRQFLCAVKIEPSKAKEIHAFSLSGPSEVVSVESLGANSNGSLKENVLINRVEYVDGTIWQRKDWKFAEIKLAYSRAVSMPWGKEMCRGL